MGMSQKMRPPLKLRVVVIQTDIKMVVRIMGMSIRAKVKSYVDITQLANVSTDGYDLTVSIAAPKCVENI